MNSKNTVIGLLAVVFTITAAVAGGFYVGAAGQTKPDQTKNKPTAQNQNQNQSPQQTADTKLDIKTTTSVTPKLTATSSVLAVNAVGTVSIDLGVNNQKVHSAEVIVKYDPAVLKLSDLTTGTAFDLFVQKTIDNSTGLLKLSGAKKGKTYLTATANVAKFKVTRLKAGQAKLSIVNASEANSGSFSSIIDDKDQQFSFASPVSLTLN
jgi:hypothetical protein